MEVVAIHNSKTAAPNREIIENCIRHIKALCQFDPNVDNRGFLSKLENYVASLSDTDAATVVDCIRFQNFREDSLAGLPENHPGRPQSTATSYPEVDAILRVKAAEARDKLNQVLDAGPVNIKAFGYAFGEAVSATIPRIVPGPYVPRHEIFPAGGFDPENRPDLLEPRPFMGLQAGKASAGVNYGGQPEMAAPPQQMITMVMHSDTITPAGSKLID